MGKKILGYLEQYVEWVAVGIGGLWCLYMLISYVLGTPVKVQLGSAEATPGNVDSKIVDMSVNLLDADMQPTKIPTMKVKSFAEDFAEAINFAHTQMAEIAVPPLIRSVSPSILDNIKNTQIPQVEQAEAIPVAPAPTFDAVSSGRSVLVPPAPAAGAVAGAPLPPGPIGANGADKDWVTVSFKVSAVALQNSFQAAKIPHVLGTTFVAVDLVRQEKQGNSWGPDVVIAPLAFNNVPPVPVQGSPQDQDQYDQWAAANVQIVVQPPFYAIRTINGGDAWLEPGTVAPVLPAADQPAPMQDVPPPPAPRTGPPARRPPTQPPTRRPPKPQAGPGALLPNPNSAPIDPARPETPFAQPYPSGPHQPAPGEMQFGQSDPTVQPGAPGAPSVSSLPQGIFLPSSQAADIKIWAHDITVLPEHTYRYKLRYTLENPVFNRPQFCKNPTLAAQWAIVSADSAWSTDVTVQSRAYFYLVGNGANLSNARFRIFKWQDGQWKSSNEAVMPGDQIGKVISGIDFTTDWTVVDIRRDPQRLTQNYALLVNEQGELVKRTTESDSLDPKLKQLTDLTTPAVAPGTPGAPPQP